MKRTILLLLGLIIILLSSSVKADVFVCPITPINPAGYPCPIPPGTIIPTNFLFLGTGLITSPSDLIVKEGVLTFPEFSFEGSGNYDAIKNNLLILNGKLFFINADLFVGNGNYNINANKLHIGEGAFNLLLVRNAYYVKNKLNIIHGAVKSNEWMDIYGALDLKKTSYGFSGVTGKFFEIQTPDGTVTVAQPGLKFQYDSMFDRIVFKPTTVVSNFILIYNDFQLNVKSMLSDGAIVVDLINNQIIIKKQRVVFKFKSKETIQLNSIIESTITPDENKVDCISCTLDVKSIDHKINYAVLDQGSIEMPHEHTHNIEGSGELTLHTDELAIAGTLGGPAGDGEFNHHKDETGHHTVEGHDFVGTLHGPGPALIDTPYSSTGAGHVGHDIGEHHEGDGDDHGVRAHYPHDTHIDIALGYSKAYISDLQSKLGEPLHEEEPGMPHEEEPEPSLAKQISVSEPHVEEKHHEEIRHQEDTESLSAMKKWGVSTIFWTLLSYMRAPSSFELGKEGVRLNPVGELHHNLPTGEGARMRLNLGTEETVSKLITQRKFGFYPSLTGEIGHASVEFKPLQGSMSFTVAYPLLGGIIAVRKEINGASTLIYQKESLQIEAGRNFLGIGGPLGKIAGVPIITYFGYGYPGEGLGHSH